SIAFPYTTLFLSASAGQDSGQGGTKKCRCLRFVKQEIRVGVEVQTRVELAGCRAPNEMVECLAFFWPVAAIDQAGVVADHGMDNGPGATKGLDEPVGCRNDVITRRG